MSDEKDDQRPPDGDFQQQNLKAWQPLLTPRWVIGTFAFIGAVFVPVGIAVLMASNGVVEVEQRYDNKESGEITLTIPEEMQPPVFMYYKLTNFYQNHRRYVKSRSDDQLAGKAPSDTDTGSCDPLSEFDDKTLYPCGLIANSYFNDTFADPTLVSSGSTPSSVVLSGDSWTDKGIAWASDLKKFKKLAEGDFNDKTMTRTGPGGFELPLVTDEDFIVWMRTAGLPTFKKLRYINKNTVFKKGDRLTITVGNEFNVKRFNGEKAIVLSTTSWLGGKNDFLGFAYIIVGALSLVLALVFFIKHRHSPRPLGDMKYFNWGSGNPAAAAN